MQLQYFATQNTSLGTQKIMSVKKCISLLLWLDIFLHIWWISTVLKEVKNNLKLPIAYQKQL